MKNLFIFLCLSLFPILSFPQWRWQNPLPQGNILESVFFTDSITGYAVGSAGTIIKTTDGGATWSIYSSGTGNMLFSVFFTDANNGFAAGTCSTGDLILKTSDAGNSWSTVFSDSEPGLESISSLIITQVMQ